MSEEQLRGQTHDRWRETLALLGLPPEPEPSAESSPPSAESARETAPAEPEPPRHFEREPEPPPVTEREPEIIPFAAPIYEELAPEAATLQEQPFPAEEGLEEPAPDQPPSLEEEDRSRGRHRSRRGGRSRSPREADDTAGVTPEEGSAEIADRVEALSHPRDDRSRGRGRDQGRRREMPESEPEIVEEDEDQEVEGSAEETAAHDRDDEPDTLSDWNVPSWQELISSLYRPER